MSKFNFIQNSFGSGEISPRLQGRTDLKQYANAAHKIKNGVVHPAGGVSRRGGTRFVDDIGLCRLIPFVFSQEESYVVALTIGAIYVYSKTRPHFRVPTILPLFDIEFNDVFNGYQSQEDIERVQFTQIGDVLVLVHPSYRPIILKRSNFATFILFEFAQILARPVDPTKVGHYPATGWPYLPVNITAITVSVDSLTLGPGRTLTASAGIFNPDMVGSYFKFTNGTVGYFYISGYTSPTVVTGYLEKAPGGIGATANWHESAWSNARGWPRSVGYADGRIIYGGTNFNPDTIWFSRFNNISVMEQATITIVNDDAFSGSIDSSVQVNEIQWISKGKTLAVGTLGAEYIVTAASADLIYGASNLPIFQADTNHGSDHVQPVRYEGALSFIQRGGLKVMEFVFDFNEQSYKTDNIAVLADHVIKDRIVTEGFYDSRQRFISLSYADSSNTIWLLDATYGLYGITRDRTNDVTAWHTHDIAGSLPNPNPGDDLKARVLSIAVIPNEGDEVWMCVSRRIDGIIRYQIEVMVDEFIAGDINTYTENSQRNNPHFLDSSLALLNGMLLNVQFYDVDIGADTLEVTKSSTSDISNFTDGIKVTYSANGTEIGGLVDGNDYYIINSTLTFDLLTANTTFGTVQLSLTQGGAAIDFTSQGTGTHTFIAEDTSTIFGRLDHLEGESVGVVADGEWVGYKTVTGGQITLDSAYANAVIGLNYITEIQTLPVEAGGQLGTAQGSIKRIDEVVFRFYRTIGCKFGRSSAKMDNIQFRPQALPMGDPIPMYTGDKHSEMLGDWDRLGVLYIRQEVPLPFTVSSVVLRGVTNDS